MSALERQITEAEARAKAASAAAERAMAADTAAWAEVARLTLLDFVAKYPAIIAFGYEVDYCYDDEGGFFPSVNVRTHWHPEHDDEGGDTDYVDEDVESEVRGYGRHALALLMSSDPDRSGELTVAQLGALGPFAPDIGAA